MARSSGVEVYLNVYDLIDQTPICCGFFHTGVEVAGVEYSFAGGAGVYDCPPKSAPDGRFRESILLGTLSSRTAVYPALDRLRPEFQGDSYSLIFKNCNDFSSAFTKALLGRDIPGRINRLARLGRMWPIRCVLPPHLRAGGDGSPGQAPLLATRTAAPQPSLFQGSGRSLGGDAGAGGATADGGGGILSRIRNTFSFGRGGGTTSNGVLLAGGENAGEARELRAAAAARRMAPTTGDVEVGSGSGSGRNGDPMPNPWR